MTVKAQPIDRVITLRPVAKPPYGGLVKVQEGAKSHQTALQDHLQCLLAFLPKLSSPNTSRKTCSKRFSQN